MTRVIFLSVISGENAQLTFLIPQGIANGRFVVDNSTGESRTSVALDREDQDSYTFTGLQLLLAFQIYFLFYFFCLYLQRTSKTMRFRPCTTRVQLRSEFWIATTTPRPSAKQTTECACAKTRGWRHSTPPSLPTQTLVTTLTSATTSQVSSNLLSPDAYSQELSSEVGGDCL